MSGWSKFLFFVPLLYFISPVDVFPDIIFPFGYIEDVGVMLVGWQMIVKELDKYRRRKEEQKTHKQEKKTKEQTIHLNKERYKVK